MTREMTVADVRRIHAECGIADPVQALHHVEFCIEQSDVDSETRQALMREWWKLSAEVSAE